MAILEKILKNDSTNFGMLVIADSNPTVNDDIGDPSYVDVGTEWLNTTALKKYICMDNSEGAADWQEVVLASSMESSTSAVFRHVEDQNTGGGSAAASTWNDRKFNTEDYNNITDCSLNTSTGVITLPEGEYLISTNGASYSVNQCALRIYDVDGAATLVDGSRIYASSGAVLSMTGYISLSGETNIKVQQYSSSAEADNGLGYPFNITGSEEAYADITITKIG